MKKLFLEFTTVHTIDPALPNKARQSMLIDPMDPRVQYIERGKLGDIEGMWIKVEGSIHFATDNIKFRHI